ncbi:MAG: hypothetical protein R2838_15060 [Caldilineaceae bacterium]
MAAALPVSGPWAGAFPVLPRRWWWTAAGLALFLTALVLAVMAWREFAANEPATMRGWWLHIASVAAVLLAASFVDGLLLPSSDGPPSLDTDPRPCVV